MENVKQFTVDGTSYNVARASAVQQDEVLSILTAPLIQRLAIAGREGIDADESVVFAMVLAMPFNIKSKIDQLLMGRVSRNGESNNVTLADFDGKVMDYNRLRTKVLMWNLSGFFTYWANECNAGEGVIQAQSQEAV